MLTWYQDLYVDPQIKKKKKKIIWNINHGAGTIGIYIITLATNEKNLMDILPANILLQKTLRQSCPMIIGLAGSYEAAVEMVRVIIENMYNETQGFNIKEYLKNK